MRIKINVLVVTVIFFSTMAFAEEEAIVRFEKVAKRMVDAINTENYLAIQQDFGENLLKAFPLKNSKPFFKKLMTNLGKIEKLNAPQFIPPDQAIFPAQFQNGKLDIKIVLDNFDKVIGLWFLPHTPPVPAIEKHQTEFSIPFMGDWFVFWGGDTKELNHHHDVPSQKYAFDFVVVDTHGRTHKDEGKKNEDYYAFGLEVLSPADGLVTDVITGVRDNVPGSMNPYSGLGNAVLIKHREHEISVLAHFIQGSIKVKVGDQVKSGQVIGLCGNSGNSSEPHLHYHLQNTPVIQDGTGIKCFFRNVTVTKNGNEQSRGRYSPVKGDLVRRETE